MWRGILTKILNKEIIKEKCSHIVNRQENPVKELKFDSALMVSVLRARKLCRKVIVRIQQGRQITYKSSSRAMKLYIVYSPF